MPGNTEPHFSAFAAGVAPGGTLANLVARMGVAVRKMGRIMTDSTLPKAAPTVEDAHRACGALPGSVFLFGSVARGTARKMSDIDLMVITDRVEGDYGSGKRKNLGIDLAREAREACGFRVQVFLVDWVEWKSRSVVWGTSNTKRLVMGCGYDR